MTSRPPPQQRYLQGEGYAAIFLLSFVFDAWISAPLPFGYLLRALLTSEILLRHWHIGRLPPRRGVLVWCLYLCAWALLVGSWAPIVWPAYTIHLEHITFIGGISLMTFAVSTRVTLSHGGHDLAPEQRSRRLLGMAALLGIALLTRLSAPFTAEYFAHLSYASVAWIAAMSCWALLIVPHLRETDRS